MCKKINKYAKDTVTVHSEDAVEFELTQICAIQSMPIGALNLAGTFAKANYEEIISGDNSAIPRYDCTDSLPRM